MRGCIKNTDYNIGRKDEMEFEKVIFQGEEYEVRPYCPSTGYPARYLTGRTEEEIQEFLETVEDFAAKCLYDHLKDMGALHREEIKEENGDTILLFKLLVLVKVSNSSGEDNAQA